MIPWDGQAMHEGIVLYPSGMARPHVAVDDLCVNESGRRADGTFCRDRAEANGWCGACWAEIMP